MYIHLGFDRFDMWNKWMINGWWTYQMVYCCLLTSMSNDAWCTAGRSTCSTWILENLCGYPKTYSKNYGTSPFWMGKFAISIAIFCGYVEITRGYIPSHLHPFSPWFPAALSQKTQLALDTCARSQMWPYGLCYTRGAVNYSWFIKGLVPSGND